MSNVYIPNKGAGHDYTPARQYGELIFVTTGSVNPFNVGTLMRSWNKALENSEEGDYIVVGSLSVLCMIGASLFATKHRRLNLLIYTREGEYRKREVIFEEEK